MIVLSGTRVPCARTRINVDLLGYLSVNHFGYCEIMQVSDPDYRIDNSLKCMLALFVSIFDFHI